MKNIINIFYGLLVAAISFGGAQATLAADVSVGLSSQETYVGLPVTLRIQVTNATKVDPPQIPTVDGLDFKSRGIPSRSTQFTSINGVTSTTVTQTYAYEVTPQRIGSFEIPEIAVNVNGGTQHTRKLSLVASKSETGDLMFVEIAGKQKQIYVGQALDLTLKIWLRPYNDRQLKLKLSEGDMWQFVSERSDWGPFIDQLRQLVEKGQRPSGKEVLRKDHDGVEHSYYLYELSATIYPKRPGNIDGNNVKIVVDYPTALGRKRDPFSGIFQDFPLPGASAGEEDEGFSPFGRQLEVKSVRPLVSEAVVEPIDVLPIPTAGKPADYRGAVGRYQIAVEASSTHVKAGDPINLLIGISGNGPMELVQAPPLAELPAFAAGFKVPNQPLAGFVKGNQKLFQVAIRPRNTNVTEIPSVPFSYFDPVTKNFATAHSAPVAIHVDPADMLALDNVKHDAQTDEASQTKQSNIADSTFTGLAVFGGDDVLSNQTPYEPSIAWLFVSLAAPPLVVLGMFALRARRGLPILTAWFRPTSEQFKREIAEAASAADIAHALRTFVRRQTGSGTALNTPEEVVGAMRASGRRNSAIRGERLLTKCGDSFSPPTSGDNDQLNTLRRESLLWFEEWQAEGRRARPKPLAKSHREHSIARTSSSSKTGAAVKIGALALIATTLLSQTRLLAQTADATSVAAPAAQLDRVNLTKQQQLSLLSEANDCYNAALDKAKTDTAEAKQGFSDASEKYQLLVNSGITNSQLYFNLANAYLQGGQPARAIANYERCLRINPTMREAQANLSHAEQLLRPTSDHATGQTPELSFAGGIARVNTWLNHHISPHAIVIVAVVTWFALWAILALRLFGFHTLWKTAATLAILLFTLAATSSVLSWSDATTRLAIVVQPNPESSSQASPEIADISAGQRVELVRERGDSVQIRTAQGSTRWVPKDSVESI